MGTGLEISRNTKKKMNLILIRAELRAAIDTVVELCGRAEDVELQSAMPP
jgi:hypothetical protein